MPESLFVLNEMLKMRKKLGDTYTSEDKILVFGVQHLLPTTYDFLRAIQRICPGAEIYLLGKHYSTDPGNTTIEKDLVTLHPRQHESALQNDPAIYFEDAFKIDIKLMCEVIEKKIREYCEQQPEDKKLPIIIVDDGGQINVYFSAFIRNNQQLKNKIEIIGIEQTTAGARLLTEQGKALQYPIISVAASLVKRFLEGPIIAERSVAKFLSILDREQIKDSEITCGIIGIGAIGIPFAQMLKENLPKVSISWHEKEEVKDELLSLTHFYRECASLQTLIATCQYIFDCSGKDIIEPIIPKGTSDLAIAEFIKNLFQPNRKTFLFSLSSEDLPFRNLRRYLAVKSKTYAEKSAEVAAAEQPSKKAGEERTEQTVSASSAQRMMEFIVERSSASSLANITYTLPNRTTIHIEYGGYPINFCRAEKFDPDPANDFQLTRGLLLSAFIQAITILKTTERPANKIIRLNPELQLFVAMQWARHKEYTLRQRLVCCGSTWSKLAQITATETEHDSTRQELARIFKLDLKLSQYLAQKQVPPRTCGLYEADPLFVGRSEELSTMDDKLMERHLLILAGEEGVGKTALAIEYAHAHLRITDQKTKSSHDHSCQYSPFNLIAYINLEQTNFTYSINTLALELNLDLSTREKGLNLEQLIHQIYNIACNRGLTLLIFDNASLEMTQQIMSAFDAVPDILLMYAIVICAAKEIAQHQRNYPILDLQQFTSEETDKYISKISSHLAPDDLSAIAQIGKNHPILIAHIITYIKNLDPVQRQSILKQISDQRAPDFLTQVITELKKNKFIFKILQGCSLFAVGYPIPLYLLSPFIDIEKIPPIKFNQILDQRKAILINQGIMYQSRVNVGETLLSLYKDYQEKVRKELNEDVEQQRSLINSILENFVDICSRDNKSQDKFRSHYLLMPHLNAVLQTTTASSLTDKPQLLTNYCYLVVCYASFNQYIGQRRQTTKPLDDLRIELNQLALAAVHINDLSSPEQIKILYAALKKISPKLPTVYAQILYHLARSCFTVKFHCQYQGEHDTIYDNCEKLLSSALKIREMIDNDPDKHHSDQFNEGDLDSKIFARSGLFQFYSMQKTVASLKKAAVGYSQLIRQERELPEGKRDNIHWQVCWRELARVYARMAALTEATTERVVLLHNALLCLKNMNIHVNTKEQIVIPQTTETTISSDEILRQIEKIVEQQKAESERQITEFFEKKGAKDLYCLAKTLFRLGAKEETAECDQYQTKAREIFTFIYQALDAIKKSKASDRLPMDEEILSKIIARKTRYLLFQPSPSSGSDQISAPTPMPVDHSSAPTPYKSSIGMSAEKPLSKRAREQTIITQYNTHPGLQYQPVIGDGNCLYRSVAYYLGHGEDVSFLRSMVAANLEKNKAQYTGFIPLRDSQSIQDYIAEIRNTSTWAGDLEINILMRLLDRPIVIIGPNGMIRNKEAVNQYTRKEPIFVFYNGGDDQGSDKAGHYDVLLLRGGHNGRNILSEMLDPGYRSSTSPQIPEPPKKYHHR